MSGLVKASTLEAKCSYQSTIPSRVKLLARQSRGTWLEGETLSDETVVVGSVHLVTKADCVKKEFHRTATLPGHTLAEPRPGLRHVESGAKETHVQVPNQKIKSQFYTVHRMKCHAERRVCSS